MRSVCITTVAPNTHLVCVLEDATIETSWLCDDLRAQSLIAWLHERVERQQSAIADGRVAVYYYGPIDEVPSFLFFIGARQAAEHRSPTV